MSGIRLPGLTVLHGLDPEKDVKLLSVGGTAQAVAAMAKGLIQFGISTEPFAREAEKVGFKTLLDIGSLKIPFHWAGVLIREATIKTKRPIIARFVHAMTEAIFIYKTEKEFTKAVIGKYLRTTDPENLERTYNSFSPLFPQVPYPRPEGVKTLLDDLAPKNPSLNFSPLEKHKATLYGIRAVSPNSYAKGEERPYGDTVYNRTDGIPATGAAICNRQI